MLKGSLRKMLKESLSEIIKESLDKINHKIYFGYVFLL